MCHARRGCGQCLTCIFVSRTDSRSISFVPSLLPSAHHTPAAPRQTRPASAFARHGACRRNGRQKRPTAMKRARVGSRTGEGSAVADVDPARDRKLAPRVHDMHELRPIRTPGHSACCDCGSRCPSPPLPRHTHAALTS